MKQPVRKNKRFLYISLIVLLVAAIAIGYQINADSTKNVGEQPPTSNAETGSTSPTSSSVPQNTQQPTQHSEPGQDEEDLGRNLDPEPEMAPTLLPSQQKASSDEINRKYSDKLATLKSECRSASDKLVDAILSEWTDGNPESLKKMQAKFLVKAVKAEAACDAKFHTLLNQAKLDYENNDIPLTSMPDWESTYAAEKSSARSAAIGRLAQAVRDGKETTTQ